MSWRPHISFETSGAIICFHKNTDLMCPQHLYIINAMLRPNCVTIGIFLSSLINSASNVCIPALMRIFHHLLSYIAAHTVPLLLWIICGSTSRLVTYVLLIINSPCWQCCRFLLYFITLLYHKAHFNLAEIPRSLV